MVSIKSLAVLVFAGLAVAVPAGVPAHGHGGDTNVAIQQCEQNQVVKCCDNAAGLASIPIGQCTGNAAGSKFSVPSPVLCVLLTFSQPLARAVLLTAARLPTTPTYVAAIFPEFTRMLNIPQNQVGLVNVGPVGTGMCSPINGQLL
jgi:hypothetical protein